MGWVQRALWHGVSAGTACVLMLAASAALAAGERHGVERVRFWHYGVEDGLSQSTARVLLQDGSGFVWIGTQDGLDRFDGQEFRIYRTDPADANSLADNHVTSLARAADGGIWIGTQAGGLAHYQQITERFTRYGVGAAAADTSSRNWISALLLDQQSRLWVASAGGSLQWLAPRDSALRPVPAAANSDFGPIRALRQRRDGGVLVAARNGVWVISADGSAATPWSVPGASRFDARDALEADTGSVWVATAKLGAIEFDRDGHLLRALTARDGALADDEVNCLLGDRLRRVWFGTLHGLSRLDAGARTPTSWRYNPAQSDGLASNRIQSLLEDRDGLIWIGTWLNGLSLFNPRTEAFTELRPEPGDPAGLPGAGVRAVLADADGTLWLGVHEGGGLVHFDLERGALARYVHEAGHADSLSHDQVNAIARSKDGALWVGTIDGLDLLRPGAKGFEHFRHDPAVADSIASNAIEFLLVDRAGNLWVATSDSGLDFLCAGCRGFAHFSNRSDAPDSLGANVVSNVFEGTDGAIWVALRPGGLARLDQASGKFEHFRPDPNRPGTLSHDTVTVIYEDHGGRLWIGTQGGGLNLMLRAGDGSVHFRSYTRKDGLAADAIGGIIEDGAGRIWASTTQGISRIEPERGRITNYDRRDGVQWRGYFIAAQALMPDQRIVFGGLLGATVFDPIKVGDDSLPRPARITAARAVTGARARGAPPASAWQVGGDGTPELQLAPATDALALEFSALHFGAPRRVEYSYRLAGFDPSWIATDSEHRIAMFTGLPPGTFHFQVRARAQGGDWSEPAELAVRHLPSFWQTWWARSVLALGGLVAFTTVAWQGRARLRERRGAERRLRQSEERLKLALWGSGDELWDMNLETRELRRANPLNHVDIPRGEYVADSATLRSSAHAEDLAAFDRGFADLIAGRSEYLDVVYRVRDQQGQWRWLRSRGRIVQHNAEGAPRRMVGTTEDISQLKEHEQALERINQDLERRVRDRTGDLTLANEQLTRTVEELRQAQRQLVDAEKMAALGGLVAGIAHEINTPLGISVTAASHLESEVRRITELLANHALKRSDLDLYQQTALESAQMILRNLQRADKLVKGFKQVAVDQSSEQRRTINLAEYLDEILTSLHPALKKTQHRVLVDCPSDIVLDTYPGALYQIMVNLAMNSLLHGFDGIEEGTIRVRASTDGDAWELDYRDDGRGMTEAVRRRIFEPFFTTKRGRGGSGLGLHIVFNLVHQVLFGTLRCESEPGKGARFILRCPVSLK